LTRDGVRFALGVHRRRGKARQKAEGFLSLIRVYLRSSAVSFGLLGVLGVLGVSAVHQDRESSVVNRESKKAARPRADFPFPISYFLSFLCAPLRPPRPLR
jgi:hypothetical protein